jgi:hypothetical protein
VLHSIIGADFSARSPPIVPVELVEVGGKSCREICICGLMLLHIFIERLLGHVRRRRVGHIGRSDRHPCTALYAARGSAGSSGLLSDPGVAAGAFACEHELDCFASDYQALRTLC